MKGVLLSESTTTTTAAEEDKSSFLFLFVRRFRYSRHLVEYRGVVSVTRLGDLWDFGQVFKAFGNN